jgi:hypothetical protein
VIAQGAEPLRVWLVDEKPSPDGGRLADQLRQLEDANRLRLLGTSPFQPDFPAAMRKLAPELLDLLVVNEAVWPVEAWTDELLGLCPGLVVVAPADRADRLRDLAGRYPLWFLLPDAGPEALWLTLFGARAAQRRLAETRAQIDRLQQRLNDRIVIERAKGILVQQLGVSEDEAYKRLRLSSRRQRRQMRDVAQSLIESQLLLGPGINGCGPVDHAEGGSPESLELANPELLADRP